MARNGSGTFSLVSGNPVTTGSTISSTWANNTLSDIATALTGSIAADGQTPVTANLPMSNYKHTGAGSATASGQYLVYGQSSASLGSTTFTGAVNFSATSTMVGAAANVAAEVDVASAGTTDIGGAASNQIRITGTTTITSFGTTYTGPRFIRFAGILTLTHNGASLILPGAANITTAAGDTCIVLPLPSSAGWYVSTYIKASGSPVAAGAITSSGYTQTTARLLGRTTASTGAIEEISVGTGLTLSAGSLSASSTGTTLTSQATTSGTVQNVTSIPSTSKRIDIALSNVSTNGTSILCVKLGDSGGVESSGYTSMATIVNGAGGPSTSTTEFILATGTSASDVWNGTITLLMVDSATNTWSISSVLTNGTNMYASSGTKATSAALDRIQLTTAGGADTFDAGLMGTQY